MVARWCKRIQKVIGHLLNLYNTSSAPALLLLRPSESLTTGLFLAAPGGGLARCEGEAGPVGMSWRSLSHAARWSPGHPILIRFAAAAICPSSVINPGCYLAPKGLTVNRVCVYVCAGVYISQVFYSRDIPSKICWDIKNAWHEYLRPFLFVCVFLFLWDAVT